MSTFTTIKTAIRDASVMLRILRGIPGAQVAQNVRLKRKDWGSMTVDFYIELSSAAAGDRLVGQFVMRGLRYFYVDRAEDGTLALHVNQDQSDHVDIESTIQSMLADHRREEVAQITQEVIQKRDEALRAINNIAAAQKHRLSGSVPLEREAAKSSATPRSTIPSVVQPDQAELRAEASRVLERMDKQRSHDQQLDRPSLRTAEVDANRLAGDSMTKKLTQEYARQKVLEQLDQIEQQYGVRLSGETTLEDGTIEITVWG